MQNGGKMKRQSLYSKQSIKRISDYPDVLTVEETSEILGVCTKTIYKMIKKGDLKKQNVGRLFRIPKSYIIAYLDIENKK
jgi:excisionase family DNA binding protein